MKSLTDGHNCYKSMTDTEVFLNLEYIDSVKNVWTIAQTETVKLLIQLPISNPVWKSCAYWFPHLISQWECIFYITNLFVMCPLETISPVALGHCKYTKLLKYISLNIINCDFKVSLSIYDNMTFTGYFSSLLINRIIEEIL